MIERCLCVYAVCHICVFGKKLLLVSTKYRITIKKSHLPFVDYVFNTCHKRT